MCGEVKKKENASTIPSCWFQRDEEYYLGLESKACGKPQEALVCVVRQLIIHSIPFLFLP